MDAWIDSDAVVVDSGGNVVLCDHCPCQEVAPVCCPGGVTLPNVYLWAYFLGANDGNVPPATPGCLPVVCAPTTDSGLQFGVYQSYGSFTGGTFDWNNGPFTLLGSCGCVNVRLIGTCNDLSRGEGFIVTIDMDFGAGFLGTQQLAHSNTGVSPNLTCVLTQGCDAYANASHVPGDVYASGYYITTRDPATGILCLDGSIIPTTITFSITLLNSLGVPTIYSCDLVFGPQAGGTGGSAFFCNQWRGFLFDCSEGMCTFIFLWFDGTNWNIQAQTHTGSFDFINIYSGTSFPVSGLSTNNWKDCGGGATTTPLWTVTE